MEGEKKTKREKGEQSLSEAAGRVSSCSSVSASENITEV